MRLTNPPAPILLGLLVAVGGPLAAQTPLSGTSSFRTRPLLPAHGDSVRLEFRGSFAYSNAQITVTKVSIEPELVTLDLRAAWDEGTNTATGGDTTAWSVDIDLGRLDEMVYDLLVRIDGEQFYFSYFIVEAARPEPVPLPAPVVTITPQRPLGINLTAMKDHARMLIFTDIFKPSRQWIPHRPSDETSETGLTLDLDDKGWVRSLAADQEAGTLMMSGVGDAYPGGRYRVLYDGTGVLGFDWDARIIDFQPGWMDLWVTPADGIHMVIQETDPDDYIRDIRVIMPGHEESFTTSPFHPTYVQFLQQFTILRFMDWSDANEPENVTAEAGLWAHRITPDHASQGTIRGVAYEYMIDRANEVGSDPWISVPITATDDFVDSLATLVRDRLDPQRIAYIELSNEI